ncbi:glycosyltransferase involved in cell wall biosynthesis [Rhodoblastus acidophilus]|uniref:glycosyltransferase n=1 Tax=Rhodoblastus acidophilus TaxID=1074 RepID=UPI0022249F2E|nr:glycosyltransferase [Rhodoblastus acidophilus]MCW2317541.1 glycosyltransferase involved in cell wall biosynthesis [Rhodoblastus acidophilus]
MTPLFEDRHESFNLAPRRWDFVLTCYEPLSLVTGGIGTYSRLLLRLLSQHADGRAILLICAADLDPHLRDLLPNISVIVAPPIHHRAGLHVEDVGNDHMRFSLAVAETLLALQNHGHSFGLIEFPDYGMEGYFSLKMRRHGQLRAEKMTVRLHSPLLMLFEDNNDPLCADDVIRRRSLGYELFCCRHADALTYGATAMRERIEAICRRNGVDIAARVVRIAHPKPEPGLFGLQAEREAAPEDAATRPDDRPLTVCYVGRLENRKGIAHFFETVADSPDIVALIKGRGLRFQLLGLDLPHDDKRSNSDVIRAAAERVGIAAQVEIFGYIDQQRLPTEFLPQADAFVFPSIFENYPNALLETLPFGKPTLVSSRGGMPEIAAPFPAVRCYDPLAPDAPEAILAFLSGLTAGSGDPQARQKFNQVARESNAKMLAAYFALAEAPAAPPAVEGPDFGVAFIVPHYHCADDLADCLASIRASAQPGDEIIVVDDASAAEEAARVAAIVAQANAAGAPDVRLIVMAQNGGPSAARNCGAAAVERAQALQFLDADDMLDADGFRATRRALRLNPDIDMVYGVQRSHGARNHFWFPTDANPTTVLDENCAHSAILVRKSAFDRLGGYAPEMRALFEDWEFNARFCLAGLTGETVMAPTQLYRVRPASRSTDNAGALFDARQTLLAHLARCDKITGDAFSDLLIAGIAGYASVLVRHGLISRAALQDPDAFKKEPERIVIEEVVHVARDATVRDLRQRIKRNDLPRWRKLASSLLLSLTKKLGRLPV